MTATSPKNSSFTPDLEAATERARQAAERLAAVGSEVAAAYVDGVERYVADFAKLERKLAQHSKADAVGSLISAHAQLTEDVAAASVSATRELITA